jgi:hypothetical protein
MQELMRDRNQDTMEEFENKINCVAQLKHPLSRNMELFN